jgi:hypothetical protein
MLLGMGLVRIDDSGGLALTDMGALRLRQMVEGYRHGADPQDAEPRVE